MLNDSRSLHRQSHILQVRLGPMANSQTEEYPTILATPILQTSFNDKRGKGSLLQRPIMLQKALRVLQDSAAYSLVSSQLGLYVVLVYSSNLKGTSSG